jgi:putative solute:sodium symporter small subunit
MGPMLLILVGCFLAWCSVTMIRRGYFIGRRDSEPLTSKRYYRTNHPLQFWVIAGGGIVMAVILIATALSRLSRG